jgi:glycosyltransferase involved in cell wall biosynthesis
MSLVLVSFVSFYSFLLYLFQYVRFRLWGYRNIRAEGKYVPLSLEYLNDCDSDNIKISIIIGLKNEARYIGKTLMNLEATTIDKRNVEIILVDGGCEDNSLDVVKASTGAIPVIHTRADRSSNSRGAALNAGFELVSGSLVLFIKADSLLCPGYDEVIRRAFRSNKGLLVSSFTLGVAPAVEGGASVRPSTPRNNPFLEQQAMEARYQAGHELSYRIAHFFANLRARWCLLPAINQGVCMRTNVFRQRRFGESLLLEDIELVGRLRYDSLVTGSLSGPRFVQFSDTIVNPSATFKFMTAGIAKYVFLEQLALLMYLLGNYSILAIYNLCYLTIPKYTYWVKL